MNDRFKFRVWDKEKNEILSLTTLRSFLEPELNYDVDEKTMIMEFNPNRYILMQCTGLKDKQGTLIYEGDIVKDDNDAWHYVKWVYDSWQLFPCTQNNYTIGIVDDEIEVIGNIYENKEILNANN